MDSNAYAALVLKQLSQTNRVFRSPPIKETKSSNTGAVLQAIVAQRLMANGIPIENKKGSRLYWSGGIILSRNSRVAEGFWASMKTSQILNLKQSMAGNPAAFLFCHFDVEEACLHAWAIPEDAAVKSIVTLPDGKTNAKNIVIDIEKQRFKNAAFALDLKPFYLKSNLTKEELDSLAAGIKQDYAAKGLSDSEDSDTDSAGEEQTPTGEFYTAETVDFVSSLPLHTSDQEWHQRNRDRFQLVLRSPTSVLFESLRIGVIEKLDSEVAGTSRNISVLKKNDYGRGEYYPHYWAAFYAPEAGSRTRSSQLFFSLIGDEKVFRYGFSFGVSCARYILNLSTAIEANRPGVLEYLKHAPSDVIVKLSDNDTGHSISIEQWEKLLASSDNILAAKCTDIVREFPLEDLPARAKDISKEIGDFFEWLWPFFQASRTGNWVVNSPLNTIVDADSVEEITDEDAPRTLAELSNRSSLSVAKLEQIQEALLAKQQIILVGPPGTSKTYIAQLFARYFVAARDKYSQGKHTTVYMHSNWGYEDFFEGIRPETTKEGQLRYESRKGRFLKWVDSISGSKTSRHVMVIDEINRCDTASVLGELLQLMESRGRNVELISGSTFRLPTNVYVIGTMNSADRSIGRIDLALRRRFLWIELLPDYQMLQKWLDKPGNNPCHFSADLLKKCNQILGEHGIQEDQQIGHALFMMQTSGNETEEPQDKPLIAEALRRIVRYSVVPYVSELFMMQLGKMDLNLASKIEQTLLSCLDESGHTEIFDNESDQS